MVIRAGRRRAFRLNRLLNSILNNPHVELTVRWLIGMIFIYASFHKIADPSGFAKIIYGYGLFPNISVNLIAIVVPFIELTAGIALITGVYPRSAALIINGLVISFIITISVNLIRGHEFDCGCFSSKSATPESAWISLIRNIGLLGMGVFVYRYMRSRRFCLLSTGNVLSEQTLVMKDC